MEILYKVHQNLYVNLTNQCPCACTFCLRQTMDYVGESVGIREGSAKQGGQDAVSLWLEHEPTFREVIKAFSSQDMTQYNEVVFCGFGEPMMAFDMLKQVASYVKDAYGKPVRVNTNGLGNLICGRDITPELHGLVDTISISLNTPDAKKYHELVRSRYGEKSFEAMLDFAKKCTGYVPNVVLTTVDTTLTKEEEAQCQKICDDIGAVYRIRAWEGEPHGASNI